MWNVDQQNISMAEGDFGIMLPITISGVTFTENDEVKFTFKQEKNGETLLEKVYGNIQDNTINLEFTSTETELFPVGRYAYVVDWYQNGLFLCNIIPMAKLKVVDKA